MSAECSKHGTDLVGYPEHPDGLHCPVCKAESRAQAAEAELEEARRENGKLLESAYSSLGDLVEERDEARTALRRAVGALEDVQDVLKPNPDETPEMQLDMIEAIVEPALAFREAPPTDS